MTAVNGVATFSGLTDDQAASGITLVATSSGLSPATTSSFTVTPLAASQLVFGAQRQRLARTRPSANGLCRGPIW